MEVKVGVEVDSKIMEELDDKFREEEAEKMRKLMGCLRTRMTGEN